jgi:exodeoxyribonuclease-3
MKISTWNVNSVRARIENIKSYIQYSKTDILMMQEIKTEEKNFPYDDFKALGYKSYVFGQKSYNGVAFISKIDISKINLKFINDKKKQSRIIVGEIKSNSKNIKLINIYVPNGNPISTEKYDYKKSWLNTFVKNIKKTLIENSNIIIGGDFNIIPEQIDVYDFKKYENDALYKLEIRKKFREVINLGFHDVYRSLYKGKQNFTFWDYMAGSWKKNHGMRIDHFLVSNNLIDDIKNINIDMKPRAKFKPSDHTPVELEIN